jgi:hypothetical protein
MTRPAPLWDTHHQPLSNPDRAKVISPALIETVEPKPIPPPDRLTIELRSYSYEDRRVILPALMQAMTQCGGWMLDRQVLPSGKLEFWLEVQLASALELYSSLIAAGIEFTRAGHLDLTSLCTLSRHRPLTQQNDRIVAVRLEISFLDESEDSVPMQATRAAQA